MGSTTLMTPGKPWTSHRTQSDGKDHLEVKTMQTQGQIPAKLKHGRRFDLAKLRPFEAMFVDNKDFPCEVRGGCKTSLVLVDYKTQLILKVNVDSKRQNGEASTKMMAICGVTKLPYKCTVYHDNDGAMKHVVKSAALLQIAAIPLPPHDQSANEAEKVCNYMWRAARMYMIDSRAPHKLFADAVDYAIYVHNRTSSPSPYRQQFCLPTPIWFVHRRTEQYEDQFTRDAGTKSTARPTASLV